MEPKTVVLVVLVLLNVLNSASTADTTRDKPIFRCTQSGTHCTFSFIVLNSTHYEWQPTSDYPEIVTFISLVGCIIPVVTKNICETFPALKVLRMDQMQLEEIKEDAFHACHELTTLHLNSNLIKRVPKYTFMYCTPKTYKHYDWMLIRSRSWNIITCSLTCPTCIDWT